MMSSHFPPWTSWHNEVLAFAAFLILAAGVFYLFRASKYIELPVLVVPMLGMGVLAGIQAFFGQIMFGGDFLVLLFYLVTACMAVMAGANLRNINITTKGRDVLSAFAFVVILGGVCSTVAALVQSLEIWDVPSWVVPLEALRRPGGNIAQPNHMATLILFGLASLLYLLELGLLGLIAGGAVSCLLLLGLAISESRTALIGATLVGVWWFAKRRHVELKTTRGFVAILGGGVVLFVLLWPVVFEILQVGGGSKGVYPIHRPISPGARMVVWPQLWAAAMLRPWLGWGVGQVAIAHNAVLDTFTATEAFTYSHNIILDLIIGCGLPIAILLVALGIFWVWKRARNAVNAQDRYAIAFLVPFLVHSLLEFPFAYSYLLFPAMFMIGVLEGGNTDKLTIHLSWRLGFGAWCIAIFAMSWSVIEYFQIEEDYRIVRFEALRLGSTPTEYERPNIHLLTQLDALLNVGRIKPAPEMTTMQIELTRKVALKYPWPATQNRYALTLALNGNVREAERQLKVMLVMHGETKFNQVRLNWVTLTNEKYPQLRNVRMPS